MNFSATIDWDRIKAAWILIISWFVFIIMANHHLFISIFYFHKTMTNISTNEFMKKHRWCAWDSNLGTLEKMNGRRIPIHRALTAPRMLIKPNACSNLLTLYWYCHRRFPDAIDGLWTQTLTHSVQILQRVPPSLQSNVLGTNFKM